MAAQAQEQPKEPVQANDKEHNFEQLRKKLEATEKAKVAAEAKAAAYEKEIQKSANSKLRDADPLDEDPYDEPYVDERRLNKKLAKFEEKFDKRVEEKAEAKARAMLEQERNTQFLKQNPDFSDVLSPEIIEKFAKKHPGMAEPMLEMPDGFARQKLLYEAIKVAGVHKAAAPAPSVQETIDKNRKSYYYQPTGVNGPAYESKGDFSEVGQKNAYDKVKELKARLRL